MDKAHVVRALRDAALLLQLKGENAYRCRAYDIGADRIAGLSEDLASLVAEGRLEHLPGIGQALGQKIAELVTTGRLPWLEALRAEFPLTILDLLKIPDLGAKKVAALWRELQIGDVASLEAACREGKVAALKGFGTKSQEKILAAIELYRRSTGRHRLGDVLPVAEELLSWIQAQPGVIRASVGGSVRRLCETVADVDLIASAQEPSTVLSQFSTHPKVTRVLGMGESKCSVRLLPDDLQADLRVLPDQDYATALHHFTGSKPHHIRLRGLAQDRGLKISEWGVMRGDEKLTIPDEEDLYRMLAMQYVPPELREDTGEVEAAQNGELPTDLVSLGDIQGLVHSHSTWSDGKNSLEEMARAAHAAGLKYLTVTDHSQTAAYAGGLTADDLRRQWDEIDRINQALPGFTLLKGSEVDILESGSLDFPENVLERLDVVIGSVHIRHQHDEEQMTRRLLRAFDNPFLNILGHPTGRLINARDPYPFRMEEVLERAAERGVVVEVNGSPKRLDLNAHHTRLAVQHGVKLVLSVDAHSTTEIGNLKYAVGTARKGWARKDDVLNILPAVEFTGALKRLRRA